MLMMPIGDHRKFAPLSTIDGAIDHNVIALMAELREQGFSFKNIAAMLLSKGLTLSSEGVKEIFDSHQPHLKKNK